MSVHVRFETPTEVSDKIYEMIQSNSNGRIKKGSNEVTKLPKEALLNSLYWLKM